MRTYVTTPAPLAASKKRKKKKKKKNKISFIHYRFLTSVAQPSIPSPLLPTGTLRLTCSIPFVSAKKGLLLIPPALARSLGSNASMGRRKLAMSSASFLLKWYFSFRTSGRAQCRRRWMLRRSPLRVKISWAHLPFKKRERGKTPRSSMIWAMWSSSLPYLVPDCGSKR